MFRHILVNYARARGFSKRGGDQERVTLAGVELGTKAQEIDVLALHEALDALAASASNRIFNPACLTEDYDCGIRLHRLGRGLCHDRPVRQYPERSDRCNRYEAG